MIDTIIPEAASASGNNTAAKPLKESENSGKTTNAAPRTIVPTMDPTNDSKRSAPIPATSPTLSPTLSAIVAGLRG